MTAGAEAIVVLNAGSSSIKFCTFRRNGAGLERELRGQVAGLGTAPRIVAKRGADLVAERRLSDGPMVHAEALDVLLDLLRAELHGETIVGVGHRVVHGGLEFMAPTRVDAGILGRLERYNPLAPLHQPHNLAAIRRCWSACRACRRWPASTRRSIAQCPKWPSSSRCRHGSPRRGCAATASTACRTSTLPRCCRRSTRARLRAAR